jgi:mRNA interferase RelE/StbE
VRIKRRAREELAQFPRIDQEEIDAELWRLSTDPRTAGLELRGTLRGTWRMQVGAYRVLYKILGDDVIVESIRRRDIAYPRTRK